MDRPAYAKQPMTRYLLAEATRERNKLMSYARAAKAQSRFSAWDIRPIDYQARIAGYVRDARRWNQVYRARRADHV